MLQSSDLNHFLNNITISLSRLCFLDVMQGFARIFGISMHYFTDLFTHANWNPSPIVMLKIIYVILTIFLLVPCKLFQKKKSKYANHLCPNPGILLEFNCFNNSAISQRKRWIKSRIGFAMSEKCANCSVEGGRRARVFSTVGKIFLSQ